MLIQFIFVVSESYVKSHLNIFCGHWHYHNNIWRLWHLFLTLVHGFLSTYFYPKLILADFLEHHGLLPGILNRRPIDWTITLTFPGETHMIRSTFRKLLNSTTSFGGRIRGKKSISGYWKIKELFETAISFVISNTFSSISTVTVNFVRPFSQISVTEEVCWYCIKFAFSLVLSAITLYI